MPRLGAGAGDGRREGAALAPRGCRFALPSLSAEKALSSHVRPLSRLSMFSLSKMALVAADRSQFLTYAKIWSGPMMLRVRNGCFRYPQISPCCMRVTSDYGHEIVDLVIARFDDHGCSLLTGR